MCVCASLMSKIRIVFFSFQSEQSNNQLAFKLGSLNIHLGGILLIVGIWVVLAAKRHFLKEIFN